MHSFLKLSLGIIAGYLASSVAVHYLLTHRQWRWPGPAWLPQDMLKAMVEEAEETLDGLEATLTVLDGGLDLSGWWPVPHILAGCTCGRCFCFGEPLPEEQTLAGARLRICSDCAQLVMVGLVPEVGEG